ncbi:hypothetical protein GOV11_04265 [Candidatus Woesearchaeota archaeon]|nr:hypothetical protein [Candidatus Woesearchaeota archaeon]
MNKYDKAKRLSQVIELRRELAGEEAKLKAFFKSEITANRTYEPKGAGITIVSTQKSRRSLDRKALILEVGEEAVDKCSRTTIYIEITVKKRAA